MKELGLQNVSLLQAFLHNIPFMSSVVIQTFKDGLNLLKTVSELDIFDNQYMISIYPRSLINVTNYWSIYGNPGASFHAIKLDWFINVSWWDLGPLFELPAPPVSISHWRWVRLSASLS